MNPKVSIIILNWNGWEDTIECLESLYQITYPNYDVIVVDNGSEDESIEKIKEYAEGKIKVKSKFFEYDPEGKPIRYIEYDKKEADAGGGKEKEIENLPSNRKLTIIKNENNYGFAEGNNIAMRYAMKALNLNPDYVLLLNNDTVVDKRFLGELVKVAESDERVGIVGPKNCYYDYNGRKDVINFAGGKFNVWKGQSYHIGINEIDKGQYDEIREVDYINGSCLLARREMIKNTGLLSLNYFTYWEENDWCMRGYRAGYKSVYVPKAKMWHKIAASSSGTTHVYYMAKNRFLFMRQHATKIQFLLFLLYFFGFQFWFTSGIFVIYHRDVKRFISFFKGVIDGLETIHR